MNIAFGFDIFYPETNGVITTTINLATNLINMGHKVYFFVPKEKEFTDSEIENGIHIVRIRSFSIGIYNGLKMFPVNSWYLAPYLVAYHIDIVHNTSPWMMGLALNHAARRLHIPSIATHHTLLDNPVYIRYAMKTDTLVNIATEAIWPVIFAPFYRLTWLCTAPNETTCQQVRDNIPGLDVRYVSNGIDISKFEGTEPTCPLPEKIDPAWLGDKTLLFVGRMGFEKAINVTLEAFSLCLEKEPDAQLIVIGQGPAEEKLKKQLETTPGKERIHMTGLIKNDELLGSKLMSKVAAFVTASLSENQTMTVIEALCSGLPVIAADVDNMRALFSENEGWFFEGGSKESLADVMCEALRDKEARDRKAEAAVKLTSRFDGRDVAKQFEGLYYELLKKRDEGFYVPGGEKKAKSYMKKRDRKLRKASQNI